MEKRYLLIMLSEYGDIRTDAFYTIEEITVRAKIENNNQWKTIIIDLENEFKRQGCE